MSVQRPAQSERKRVEGFTLVELLVVVVIIGILSVVGISIFTGTRQKANDAKKKADVEAIVKAFEVNYNPSTGRYPVWDSTADSLFASGKRPTSPEGGSYTVTPGGTGFQVCAPLGNIPACSSPSATCYCKQSSQEQYISGLPTPTPGPTGTPTPTPAATSTPTPTPTPGPGSCPQLANLVAYWKMDEAAWSGAADEVRDSFGANHGTAQGGVNTIAGGQINRGGSFDGSNDYVDAGNAPALNITGPITIAAWIKPSSLARRFVVAKDFNDVRGYAFGIEGSGTVYFEKGGGILLNSGIAMLVSTWYHIALTYDGTTWKTWLNGTQVGSTTGTGIPSQATTSLTIGRRNYPGSESYFPGTIDEVGIWNRGLTLEEVSQLWNLGFGITCP